MLVFFVDFVVSTWSMRCIFIACWQVLVLAPISCPHCDKPLAYLEQLRLSLEHRVASQAVLQWKYFSWHCFFLQALVNKELNLCTGHHTDLTAISSSLLKLITKNSFCTKWLKAKLNYFGLEGKSGVLKGNISVAFWPQLLEIMFGPYVYYCRE